MNFEPLTLSQKQLDFLASIASESQTPVASNYRMLLRECEAQAQDRASLRQRLLESAVSAWREQAEQAEAALEEMRKQTEHYAISSARRQKLIERISRVLDVKDSANQRDMALSLLGEIRADLKQSLVEDAVAEMVAADEADDAAELQRRRSPTGQK